jgi:rare lipoprotein A
MLSPQFLSYPVRTKTLREEPIGSLTGSVASVGTIRKKNWHEFETHPRSLGHVCGIGNRTIEKINRGVMMLSRSSAAICGALVTLAISVTIARTESVHSSTVVNEAAGDAIVGAASTYNPFKPGWREGGPNTASGERYDPSVWAAAIKTTLREKFGGVQYGARPKYALVEAVGKKIIVKINDVGPLTPGRIIDLNERAMRYFDPSMEVGVIYDVIVRPLAGDYWIPGPVG